MGCLWRISIQKWHHMRRSPDDRPWLRFQAFASLSAGGLLLPNLDLGPHVVYQAWQQSPAVHLANRCSPRQVSSWAGELVDCNFPYPVGK